MTETAPKFKYNNNNHHSNNNHNNNNNGHHGGRQYPGYNKVRISSRMDAKGG